MSTNANGLSTAPATAYDSAGPKPKPDPPPLGIERNRKEALAPKEFAPTNDATVKMFLDFLANPNVDAPPVGWRGAPPMLESGNVCLLPPFHTKNCRPAVLATAPEWNYLLVALRGKRAQKESKLFEVDTEAIHAIGHALRRVGPRFPCNLHPLFNSILSRVSNIVRFSGRQSIAAAWALMNKGAVRVLVVPANDATIEISLDKLAHRDLASEVTREKADEHLSRWMHNLEALVPPEGCRLEGILTSMKLACVKPAAPSVAAAPAPAPAAAPRSPRRLLRSARAAAFSRFRLSAFSRRASSKCSSCAW